MSAGIEEILARLHPLRWDVDPNHIPLLPRVGHPLAQSGDGAIGCAGSGRLQSDARVLLRHDVGVGVVEQGQGPADGERRGDRADHDGDLLALGRGSNQKAGFQVLTGGAGISRGHRDHSRNGDGAYSVVDPRPSDQEEDRGGADQGGDGHAGNGISADPDLPGDPGRDHYEEEAEDDNQNGAQQIYRQLGDNGERQRENDGADQGDPDWQVDIGAQPAGGHSHTALEVLEPGPKGADDRGQRPEQGNDPGRGHRARPYIEDERGPDLGWTHVTDELGLGEDRLSEAGAEQLDRGDQYQVCQRAAGEQVARDAGADDVADAHELGRHFGGDRCPLIEGGDMAGVLLPRLEPRHQELVQKREAERLEQEPGLEPALVSGDQYLGAGGALGIGQVAVL